MKTLLILGLVLLTLAACTDASDDEPAEQGINELDSIPTFAMIASPTPLPLPITVNDSRFPILPDDAGKALYEQHCAACHGIDGEGQDQTTSDLIVAPPHNNAGHTWHHPDQQNFATVWNGRHASGALPMPGFGSQLSAEDVFSILAYIKTWWGDAELDAQLANTRNAASGG